MPVKVKCSGCEKVLNAPDAARGKVLKCPACGEKIKVPAGQSSAKPKAAPKKEPKSGDSGEFLSGLNVNQLEAEHGEERVCPYCAKEMKDPDDPVCRKCGMNVDTGRMDSKMAAKKARRGPDPALFYSKAWSDSWEFLLKHWRLAVRTGGIWTAFLTVAFSSVFLILIWVGVPGEEPAAPPPAAAGHGEEEAGERSSLPVIAFWGCLGTVFAFGVPGWYWSLSLKVINHTMEKQEIKEDRIQFDMFEAIALGLRVVFWPTIVMLPAAPIWLLLFAFLGGGMALLSGGSAPVIGLTFILVALSYFLMPFVLFPQRWCICRCGTSSRRGSCGISSSSSPRTPGRRCTGGWWRPACSCR
ncbi:MAG: hypothetical protein R3B90_19535 [Planctomycetaceae bacterium]